MKKLIATAVSEIRQDSNGRDYKQITLQQQPYFTDEDGEVVYLAAVRSLKQNAYKENYLNGTQDALYNLPQGGKVMGDIVTAEVEPFSIPESRNGQPTGNNITITKDTFLVFADSDDEDGFAGAVESAKNARQRQRDKQLVAQAGANPAGGSL